MAGEEGGHLCHLKRKVVFDFGELIFTEYPDHAQHIGLKDADSETMFTSLAGTFGGDLVVNGDIYYSNRIQKERILYTFPDPTKPGAQWACVAKGYALQKLGGIYSS